MISERGEQAKKYFQSGYNCAQSVLMAFADKTDLTEQQIMNISAPFGAGMSRMREVCGTVSGMFMAAGLISGNDAGTVHGKNAVYTVTQDLANQFKNRNGSIICRELLADGSQKRSCADLCYDAAEILESCLDLL